MSLLRRGGRVAGNALQHLASWPLRVLARRDPRRWVFAGCGGLRFADNSAWLFLWVARNRPDLDVVWLTRRRAIARRLRRAGLPAALSWSPRGLWRQARAGVAVLSHGPGDLFQPALGQAFVANLWHGLPIKHIMLDHPADLALSRPATALGRWLQPLLRPGLGRAPDIVYGMTPPGADRVAAAARLPPGSASGAGSPRLQALTPAAPAWPFPEDLATLDRLTRGHAGPTVLFLPTWGTQAAVRETLLGPSCMEWLRHHGARMVLKPHPNDPPVQPPEHWGGEVAVAAAELDATLLIARADILVTDVSSAFLDMLAAGRPVVLVDTVWKDDRGSYQRPEEFIDGGVASTQEAFIAALERAASLARRGRSNASAAARPWLPKDIATSCRRVADDLLGRAQDRGGRAG